ncbi:uncharacterized protein PRCAT00002506001 [Priceomyces carsonii]|uniref:uncharacterized protein n=1 Tax=Priceomyces carsonii TaxID=28549 RepID=UPI002EDB7497|nr:unnamed protein product [Priceomyces carsonii]
MEMSREESKSDIKILEIASSEEINKEFDVAFKFLKENGHELKDILSFKLSPQLLRKIDFRIIPILCIIYFLQFLDKTLLNYSAAMGIKENLQGNEFSNLSTIFYASYIFAEPFASYFLQIFPISKGLGVGVICWGIVLSCHSACKTYASLMVVRSLLGIFESCSAVGIISISGMYYTKPEQISRVGIWSIQSGTGTIVGALLSFAFQHVHTTRFTSWQILFLVVGILTFSFGVFVWFYLPDNVTSTSFLNNEEKLMVLEHIRPNKTGTENKRFKKEQVYELLFKDKFTWPMLLLTMTSQIVTGAVGTYSVTVIGTFGFNNYASALVQIPIGVIIIIIIFASSQLVAHFGRRTFVAISMMVPSIVGSIALLCLRLDQKLGNLFSLYLLYSGSSVLVLIYAWNSANTAGYTKRMFRNALTLVFFSLASLIGPQMFQAYSAPSYVPAKIAILVTQAVSIPLLLLIGYMSKVENKKRDGEMKSHEEGSLEFLDLTDIENRDFRYSY